MKYVLTVALLSYFLLSCGPDSKYALDKNDLINKVFEKEEVRELKLILNYFDKKVLTNTNKTNVSDAYMEFFRELSESESLENLKELIYIQDPTPLHIENLKVFNDIWITKDEKFRIGDSLNFETREVIELNLQGKYIQFLKIAGESNEFINNYFSQVESAGSISPTALVFIMNGFNKIDFNNEVFRLIWAIHYITVGLR